ncbi:hypothetical protein HDU87_000131 [Geranomyces variabilis]|uniref:Uncharacterized protein n=1 Tax=Geranomyces variabilis TaxID=109894 RepID=A0AAD5TS29_9FUNG|nr:hypothetical protein HDU87_000131 [Geranomyces variabilis]
MALQDEVFEHVATVQELYAVSQDAVRAYGNSLPLLVKANKMETFVLRDFEGDGSSCEEKGWTYGSAAGIMRTISRQAGFLYLPTFYSIRRQAINSVNAAGTSEADIRQVAGHNASSWTFVEAYLLKTSRVDIQSIMLGRPTSGHALETYLGLLRHQDLPQELSPAGRQLLRSDPEIANATAAVVRKHKEIYLRELDEFMDAKLASAFRGEHDEAGRQVIAPPEDNMLAQHARALKLAFKDAP